MPCSLPSVLMSENLSHAAIAGLNIAKVSWGAKEGAERARLLPFVLEGGPAVVTLGHGPPQT